MFGRRLSRCKLSRKTSQLTSSVKKVLQLFKGAELFHYSHSAQSTCLKCFHSDQILGISHGTGPLYISFGHCRGLEGREGRKLRWERKNEGLCLFLKQRQNDLVRKLDLRPIVHPLGNIKLFLCSVKEDLGLRVVLVGDVILVSQATQLLIAAGSMCTISVCSSTKNMPRQNTVSEGHKIFI